MASVAVSRDSASRPPRSLISLMAVDFFVIAAVRVEDGRGAGQFHLRLDARIGFAGNGRIKRRELRGVGILENRLRGLKARGRVGRLQGQVAQ